jgi:hypothetical protein
MTKEQFKEKKEEIGFIEGNLDATNVQKLFTLLREVNDREQWNNLYSASVDYSKAEPLDYSLPQYQNYGK